MHDLHCCMHLLDCIAACICLNYTGKEHRACMLILFIFENRKHAHFLSKLSENTFVIETIVWKKNIRNCRLKIIHLAFLSSRI